jgi:gliotoxin/aspirochlorine biosynthesis peptide synthetase
LDRDRRLTPPGVVGEIYLAGVQVARGYIGRPDETAARFLADNIFGKAGEQMYRTGDRGYWTSSGEVQCLGRMDRQIKLRGYRLDLNDLETRIAQGVPELVAVSIAQKDDYLVAMVQPVSLDATAVRSTIAKVLPVHALPRIIAAVDKFPMTPIGKVDYKAIAATIAPPCPQPISTKASSSHSERLLISAWREALSLDDGVSIDGDSNFVALGGHSLAQLLLVGRLSALFGCQIPLRLIIQAATLRDLAQAIDELKYREASSGDTQLASTLGNFEVSPMEREWWQKYQANVGSSCFNVSLACALDKDAVDIDRLEEAWNTTMARHRLLYSRYVLHRRLGVRRICSDLPPRVRRVQKLDVQREINRPFQLHRNNAIRVTITEDRMVAVLSHIICDYTTLELLLREVHSAYAGKGLPPLPRSYMETTLWSEIAPRRNLDFWSKYLQNARPCSYGLGSHSDRISYDGTSRLAKVPVSIYKRMIDFTATHKVTLHQMALATAALALQIETDDTDVMLGGPYLNRPTAEDLGTVGLFLEPLPIRVRHSSDKTASSSASFLHSVQESSQSALSHAVPWTQLVQHMKLETDFPNHPVLETMVTFHGDLHAVNLALPGLEPLLTWAEGSKFKLLIEFSAVSEETLLLRLEYDTDVFSGPSILRVEKLILGALDCLLAEVPVPQIKARLRQMAEFEPLVESEHTVPFGTKLSEL